MADPSSQPPGKTITVSPEAFKWGPARLEFADSVPSPSMQSTAPDLLNLSSFRASSSLGQTYTAWRPPPYWLVLTEPSPSSYQKANIWGQCYVLAPTPQQTLIHQTLFPEIPSAVTTFLPSPAPVGIVSIITPIVPLWLLPPLAPSLKTFKQYLQEGVENDAITRRLPGFLKDLLRDNLADTALDQSDEVLDAAVDALAERAGIADPATKKAVKDTLKTLKGQYLEGKGAAGLGGGGPFLREAAPPVALTTPPIAGDLGLQGTIGFFGLKFLKGFTIKGDLDADFHPSRVRPVFSSP
jgi:hypothetical protein